MNQDITIIGICQSMCPNSEITERERALLIHHFEKQDEQIANPGRNIGNRGNPRKNDHRQRRFTEVTVKADRAKIVKAFSRPAAGVRKNIPSDLRPAPVLKRTVAYLLTEILVRTDVPFIDVYDFVFDRLRAVRQDMVIQRITDEAAILIYEAIIKFHLFAEFKFRYNAPMSYDPAINRKHLHDCLKTLLSLYGHNNYNDDTRSFFEALYCISSPESYEVISRAISIRDDRYIKPVFLDAFDMCSALQQKNYYRFFQLLETLPPLLSAFAVMQVYNMRVHALKVMSMAYGVQTCKIPLEWVEELLGYPSAAKAEKDMRSIGCEIIKDEDNTKFVKFSKSTSAFQYGGDAIPVSSEVKRTVLAGLDNVDLVARQHICPWGQSLL